VSQASVFESRIPSLQLLHRGKVRDVYAVDDGRLLFVASDRLSAFDVVLEDPIPGKGQVLTEVSLFWFEHLGGLCRNHLTGDDPLSVVTSAEADQVTGRAMVVRRLKPLPVEAIVRGYLIGSGWKDYQASGSVSGIRLPAGLRQAQQLPEVIFTPSTKATEGHDQNISFEAMVQQVGDEVAQRVRSLSIRLYLQAAEYARPRGLIIADTKFEFGLDDDGDIVLIDEVLTPDSSRFWPLEGYATGISPPSYDKQFVRDYLESVAWDKKPPAPRLPAEVIARTAQKYREAQRLLTGR
jgi:phosphoribosylaminoimidazole-succinocarboxamide synthase